jgi:hypothetical protein
LTSSLVLLLVTIVATKFFRDSTTQSVVLTAHETVLEKLLDSEVVEVVVSYAIFDLLAFTSISSFKHVAKEASEIQSLLFTPSSRSLIEP